MAGTEAVAAPKNDPNAASKKFRKAVTPGGIGLHLDAFQKIADANDGTRASGTPGYAASRDYVVKELRAAGYKPKVQTFAFPFFSENADAELQRTAPSAKNYTLEEDFYTMECSGSGEGRGAGRSRRHRPEPEARPPPAGARPSGLHRVTVGDIALIQRGTCDFAVKARTRRTQVRPGC